MYVYLCVAQPFSSLQIFKLHHESEVAKTLSLKSNEGDKIGCLGNPWKVCLVRNAYIMLSSFNFKFD